MDGSIDLGQHKYTPFWPYRLSPNNISAALTRNIDLDQE